MKPKVGRGTAQIIPRTIQPLQIIRLTLETSIIATGTDQDMLRPRSAYRRSIKVR